MLRCPHCGGAIPSTADRVAALLKDGQGHTPGEMARLIGVRGSVISRLLRRLERAGSVEYLPAGDGRTKIATWVRAGEPRD